MKKRLNPRFLLLIELALSLCVCAAIVLASVAILRTEAERHMSEVMKSYAELETRYVSVFRAIASQVREKLAEDPSFGELNLWLQGHEQSFREAVGKKIYDGFAVTYKGGYAHSWNYGNYADYDPNTRVWYQAAQKADGKVAVVPPYVTYVGGQFPNSDQYIELSVVQKLTAEISLELDIKIYDINALFSHRSFVYAGSLGLLFDKNGYILSTTDKTLYCHNIGTPDQAVSESLSKLLLSLRRSGGFRLAHTDGGFQAVFSICDQNGNTYCTVVPLWSVFAKNVLASALILLLLALLEIGIYTANKRALTEMAARDEMITAITRGAFERQLWVDVDTMECRSDGDGLPQPEANYRDFYRQLSACLTDREAQKDLAALLAPENLAAAENRGFLSGKFSFNFTSQEGAALNRTLSLSLLVVRLSGKLTASVMSNDVTDEERCQQQITESIAHYYTAVATGSTDSDHIDVIKLDQNYAALLDLKPDGGDLNRLYAQKYLKEEYAEDYVDALSMDTIRRRLSESEGYSFTVQLRDGRWQTCRLIRSVGFEENHRFVFFSENTDEQMRRQQLLKNALAKAEAAARAKDDFLSRMSHDIRTPLNGIIGMTHIASGQSNPPATADCLRKIDTSSRFLLGLVNDILDMSKAESGRIELHPEPYLASDFSGYIDSVIRPLCESKHQLFTAEIQTVKASVPIIDSLHFNQIVFNLLSNAVKYTPVGGRISLRISEALTTGHRDRITIIVSDNGIGISEEFQKVLFEPFSQEARSDTAENRGTGLGLAIVKKLVDLMGGSISVKSKLGEGTTFTVLLDFDYLEAEQSAWNKDSTSEAADCAALAGRRILLCEDHPLNQEIARALLEEKNMTAAIADNGQQGVELFSRSAPGFYDAILMDIRMPVMDGYKATAAIRALPRADAAAIPIIAMTADAFEDDVRKCLDAGMNGHVAKPIEPQALYKALLSLLKKQPQSRPAADASL